MQTVMTTNNGSDAILLVDATDEVVSAWTATPTTVADYMRDGADADNWERGQFEGFDGECTEIEDYGTECGRNGTIEDPSRLAFWVR